MAVRLDELAQLSFAEHSLESVLRTVTELATRILPGQPLASVTVIDDGRPSTVAASDDLAVELDRFQYRAGAGPCLEAASTGRRTAVTDTRADRTWPEFAAAAASSGFGSVLSFPLPAQELVSGAMNLYARQVDVADPRTAELVSRLATYAVGPVSNMYLYESAVERATHLQAALESRAVIDQAKGILMGQRRCTAEEALWTPRPRRGSSLTAARSGPTRRTWLTGAHAPVRRARVRSAEAGSGPSRQRPSCTRGPGVAVPMGVAVVGVQGRERAPTSTSGSCTTSRPHRTHRAVRRPSSPHRTWFGDEVVVITRRPAV